MGVGATMQSLAEILSSDSGSLVLGLAALVAIAAPFIDRYFIRRRRMTFRVLYNSKIGLSPIDLHDGENGSAQAAPQLEQVARLLDRMSIVVIRVHNTGSFDIAPSDFEIPLSFTFGSRIVWDARVSDATDDGLRQHVRDGLEFFTRETPQKPVEGVKLSRVRALLPKRFAGLAAEAPPEAPEWHGVRFARLSLKRKEKFKLVVVLRESDEHDGEISKEIDHHARLAAGRIKDDRKQRRFGWPVITTAVGVLLTGALLATLLVSWSRPGDSAQCATGKLSVEGSSAFVPIIDSIAAEYHGQCDGAAITTRATGSVTGVRALAPVDAAGKDELAVLSDGRSGEAGPELEAKAVAVVVYSLVVNRAAGVDKLTTQQVKDIFSGRVRNWDQLRPGPSVPIGIVGRGQESGTRKTFEQKVLGGSEDKLTSDSCRKPERDPAAATTRCERGTTAEVLTEVAAVPGAIGYADVPAAKTAAARDQLGIVQLDGHYPDVTTVGAGYRFWTVEYLYTKGVPANGSVLKHFLDYLASPTARAELQDAGYTPCVAKDGLLDPLCTRPDI
ncbi:ABC-type phosphate transport system, substrate-binding protein [Amycolatopsis pretoriensis]|uniref:ABC-type phosphate transport system, substrate-binding protein n=1 Tax=Amycolatopsis pretoriensis TaxID=218821 RepID=A0A1H5QLT1_9PSEU|nr:substrate-binding domain-containing protein [Amycolatopsis pretoriensis]SEF27122.1 ABC-type phosphate transport system, substrate-binding protein [Amycolatopsis pretoriensis]